MTPHDSHLAATAINARNFSIGRRAEAAADLLVALVVAAIGAAALLHFAMPCADGALCMAAVLPTRTPWAQRLRDSLHTAWVRWRIASARDEILQMQDVLAMAQAEQTYLPPRIAAHEAWIIAQQATLQRLTGTAH